MIELKTLSNKEIEITIKLGLDMADYLLLLLWEKVN